jgi:nicotinate-nucleotide adenylyltransferase
MGSSLPLLNHPMAPVPRIAIFGGTFDPVHEGHLHLATLAKEAFSLDQVRFLPCKISPHKSGSHPASAEDRLEMLRRATADLPWAEVDDLEARLTNDPSYSYITAEIMARRFPAASLFWIMGGDQWDALPQWKSPERLAACVEFIVLARGEPPQPRTGYRLHIVQGQHPASASAIRAAVDSNHRPLPWLSPGVEEWITKHNLYQKRKINRR